MSDRLITCPACAAALLSTEGGSVLVVREGALRAPAPPSDTAGKAPYRPYSGRSPFTPSPGPSGPSGASPEPPTSAGSGAAKGKVPTAEGKKAALEWLNKSLATGIGPEFRAVAQAARAYGYDYRQNGNLKGWLADVSARAVPDGMTEVWRILVDAGVLKAGGEPSA